MINELTGYCTLVIGANPEELCVKVMHVDRVVGLLTGLCGLDDSRSGVGVLSVSAADRDRVIDLNRGFSTSGVVVRVLRAQQFFRVVNEGVDLTVMCLEYSNDGLISELGYGRQLISVADTGDTTFTDEQIVTYLVIHLVVVRVGKGRYLTCSHLGALNTTLVDDGVLGFFGCASSGGVHLLVLLDLFVSNRTGRLGV